MINFETIISLFINVIVHTKILCLFTERALQSTNFQPVAAKYFNGQEFQLFWFYRKTKVGSLIAALLNIHVCCYYS